MGQIARTGPVNISLSGDGNFSDKLEFSPDDDSRWKVQELLKSLL